jgi:TetR/AcrR family transcriptional regulator
MAGKHKAPAAATPGTRRRNDRAEQRRDVILQAALAVFSRQGMAAASMEKIAEQAGLSKTNLFYYFRSKEEIYAEILGRLLSIWLAPLDRIAAEADPLEALGDYIRQKLIFSRDHPEASRVFCLEMVAGAPLLAPHLHETLLPLLEAKMAVLRGWMAEGRLAVVEPCHLFFTIWATTQHYADFAAQVRAVTGQGLEDPAFLDSTVRDVSRILLQGLGPAPAPKN